MKKTTNILVTLNSGYIPYLNVMLSSAADSNPDTFLNVYLLHGGIDDKDLAETKKILDGSGKITSIKADEANLVSAPVTDRYPHEMYYRIFAAKYLPENLDKVLYLDPDIIVNGSLDELYNTDMSDCLFAAATHTGRAVTKVNNLRINSEKDSPYINSGVMLMNLERLRKEQDYVEVFDFINRKKKALFWPDQDIISSLYGNKIKIIDTYKFNMTELLYASKITPDGIINLDWVRKNSSIIHYCGRNKPWKENYFGKLDVFYTEAEKKMRKKLSEKTSAK